jgi:hypothetical protein
VKPYDESVIVSAMDDSVMSSVKSVKRLPVNLELKNVSLHESKPITKKDDPWSEMLSPGERKK